MDIDIEKACEEFGISEEQKKNTDYYKFKSKLTGKEVDTEIMDDDIIIDGELRRIIRDETGNIPDYAYQKGKGMIRVTPDSKLYIDDIERKIKYSLSGRSTWISLGHSKCKSININRLVGLAYLYEEYEEPSRLTNTYKDNTLSDITTLKWKLNNLSGNGKLCGVGYNSKEKHKTVDENLAQTWEYTLWSFAMKRCYGKYKKYKSYEDCEICETWHDFQSMADWLTQNKYKTKSTDSLQLDKDILHPGNRIYSPENCLIVTKEVNMYFLGQHRIDSKYGAGVIFSDKSKYKKFQAMGRNWETGERESI